MALKEKLGEDGYAELMGLLMAPQPTVGIKAWLRGAAKSWTAWLGALLIAAPEVLPALLPHFEELMTPDRYQRFVQIIGIAVILLRVKTTTSLKDKV